MNTALVEDLVGRLEGRGVRIALTPEGRISVNPAAAVDAALQAEIKLLRNDIVAWLSGTIAATPSQPLQDRRPETVPDAPVYCCQCGNLDFYWSLTTKPQGWVCGWCSPRMVQEVAFPGPRDVKCANHYWEPGPFGDRWPHLRKGQDFFGYAWTQEMWPAGWFPPAPCGPAREAMARLGMMDREEEVPYGAS